MLSAPKLAAVVLVTVSGLLLAYAFHLPLSVGFIAGLLMLVYMTLNRGVPIRTLLGAMGRGALHTKEVIWILLLVGVLIPTWTASGTIPYLIDSGLSLLSPAYLVTFSFVFSAVVSMVLGTSTGTLSSVGIPMIGIAAYLNIPLGVVAGALVSGAFVGDRTSPFSSAHQLLAASTGMKVKEQMKHLAPTTIVAVTVCIVFYALCDWYGGWGQGRELTEAAIYANAFRYSPLLLIPLAVFIGINLLRLPTKVGFMLSSAAAIVVGTALQDIAWGDWLRYIWAGYESVQYSTLHTKGVYSMIDLVALIALAGAFNGILEETRLIEPYMEKLLGGSKSMTGATLRTASFGTGLTLVSCTQTLPIMMTGRNLLPLWQRRFPQGQLSRVIADAPLVLAALVPWNLLAILCATIVDVPWGQYAVFAVFLWCLPLLTLIASGVYDWRRRGRKDMPNAMNL